MALDRAGGYGKFIGGSGQESSAGVAVDAEGNAYVAGETHSFDFPTVPGLSVLSGATDAFVAKFGRDGSTVYVTLVGGSSSDGARAIAVNRAGEAHITGATYSDDFPRVRPFQSSRRGSSDCFVVKLNSDGDAYIFSTYLGGESADVGRGIAVDNNDYVYVTGTTFSGNFPVSARAMAGVPALGYDAFVAVFDGTGEGRFITLLGGSECSGIDIVPGPPNPAGRVRDVFVTGYDQGRRSLPSPVPTPHPGGGLSEAFVARINWRIGRFEYVAYLGGWGMTAGMGIAVDGASKAHVTGFTESPDFYTTDGVSFLAGWDADDRPFRHAFAAKLDPGGTLLYSVLMQGSDDHDQAYDVAVNESGRAFITGGTTSSDFPISPDALIPRPPRTTPSGFVAVLSPGGIREYCTHFGSFGVTDSVGICLGPDAAVFLTGNASTAAGFPVGTPGHAGGIWDAYVARLRWL